MVLGGWRLAVAAFSIGLSCSALAADFPFPGPPAEPITKAPVAAEWLVTIGAEIRADPAWPGAPMNKFALGGLPLFALQKPGDSPFFFGARDGFGFAILDYGQLQVGPVATINYPRYVWQYNQLNGLGEVPWALQLGGYGQWWAVPWLRVRGEVRQGIWW
jgi:outer membrane protein